MWIQRMLCGFIAHYNDSGISALAKKLHHITSIGALKCCGVCLSLDLCTMTLSYEPVVGTF
jgi:hypothetical protein